MIVRDEAAVIRRALKSARPYIDTWLILDTGSVDSTRALAEAELSGLPGVYVAGVWRGFAESRNEALALARERADYVMFLDADDVVRLPSCKLRLPKGHDVYYWWAYDNAVRHLRVAIVASSLPCTWKGEIHEFLVLPYTAKAHVLEVPSLQYLHDGQRGNSSYTLKQDVALLRGMLLKDPDDSRAAFYLARTLRQLGDILPAFEAYERRLQMSSDNQEEIWFCSLELGHLAEECGHPTIEVMERYARCSEARETRAEPILQLARLLRETGRSAAALTLAKHCTQLPIPNDLIYVDTSAYGWRAWDEVHTNATLLGNLRLGLDAGNRALRFSEVTAADKIRIGRNLRLIQRDLSTLSVDFTDIT